MCVTNDQMIQFNVVPPTYRKGQTAWSFESVRSSEAGGHEWLNQSCFSLAFFRYDNLFSNRTVFFKDHHFPTFGRVFLGTTTLARYDLTYFSFIHLKLETYANQNIQI